MTYFFSSLKVVHLDKSILEVACQKFFSTWARVVNVLSFRGMTGAANMYERARFEPDCSIWMNAHLAQLRECVVGAACNSLTHRSISTADL